MESYHIIYKDKNGNPESTFKEFETFKQVEDWLESINAIDWQIGVDDNKLSATIKEITGCK